MISQPALPGFDLRSGRALRDDALDLLARTRATYVAAARLAAQEHCRQHDTITCDKLRELCPVPAGIDARVVGAVLASPMFTKITETPTMRPTSHHRPVGVFRLRA